MCGFIAGRKKSTKPTLIDTGAMSDDDTEDFLPITKSKKTSKSFKRSVSTKMKEPLVTKKMQKNNPGSDDNETLENTDARTRPPSRLGKEREKGQVKTMKDKLKPRRKGKGKGNRKESPSDSDNNVVVEKPFSPDDEKITKEHVVSLPPSTSPAVDHVSPSFKDVPAKGEGERREEVQPNVQNSERVEVPSLTDAERSMTVEEWIRHEMAVQHEKLRQDGEMRIQLFREMAAQVRARIEAL